MENDLEIIKLRFRAELARVMEKALTDQGRLYYWRGCANGLRENYKKIALQIPKKHSITIKASASEEQRQYRDGFLYGVIFPLSRKP